MMEMDEVDRRFMLSILSAACAVGQETAESLYLQSGDKQPSEAIPLLLKSIHLRPTFEAHYRLGVSYIKSEDYNNALESLREAYRLTTPDQSTERAHIFFRRAEAHEGLGEIYVAYQELEVSLALEEHPLVRKKLFAVQNVLSQREPDARQLKSAFDTAKDLDIRPTQSKSPSVPIWVNFDVGQHTLTPAGKRQTDVLANELLSSRNSDYRFLVVGHTDSSGNDRANEQLSIRRAAEVKAFLLDRGLEASRVRVEGRGSRQPMRPGSTEADFRVNRRVEVVLERIP
jgi:outer membrane protein OmpA-like peptidoglycan-associated protein